jgi:integrase
VAANTALDYSHAVRLLVPAGRPFPKALLTRRRLSEWMAQMDGAAATKHHRWSALRHFIAFLLERQVLSENPAEGVKRPKLPDPRLHYLDSPMDCIRLAERQPQPFADFSILIHGTGADVSPALKIRRRDVDVEHKEAFCPGTKNFNRKRVMRVADWAWPYIEPRIARLGPNDLLFAPDEIDRYKQWRVHKEAAASLVAEGYAVYAGYTPRDARHTYAVRAIRAGVPAEVVGRQLGHKDGRMVTKVYGRFVPRQSERDYWERVATEREQRRTSDAL